MAFYFLASEVFKVFQSFSLEQILYQRCQHVTKGYSYLLTLLFVTVFLGYNQYWSGEFMVFVVLCPGAPEDSTGSGFGFKAS